MFLWNPSFLEKYCVYAYVSCSPLEGSGPLNGTLTHHVLLCFIYVFDNYFWDLRLEALIVASNWSAQYRHMVILLQFLLISSMMRPLAKFDSLMSNWGAQTMELYITVYPGTWSSFNMVREYIFIFCDNLQAYYHFVADTIDCSKL